MDGRWSGPHYFVARLPGSSIVLAAIITGAAIAWMQLARDGLAMPSHAGAGEFVSLWALMVTAMMLPAVAPVGSIYARHLISDSNSVTRVARVAGLVCGYLFVWITSGLPAFVASRWMERLVLETSSEPWVAAAILAGAGIYQLSPLKHYCLRRCRSSMALLLRLSSYEGALRDIRVGLYHGCVCVGCCWALMLTMLAVGTMNLAWMAVLCAVMTTEKVWRHGQSFAIGVGIVLIATAPFVVLGSPEMGPMHA
jgi:predicted metal-binding membrane protein